MLTSILHRFSGAALSAGSLIFVAWLLALAGGPGDYALFIAVASSWFGKLVFIGISLAAFFHFANGIRHLFWDAGLGFEKATATRTAWVVVLSSLGATTTFWLVVFFA